MALISAVLLLVLLVNQIDACNNCPNGELTGYLPTPAQSPSLFKLRREFPSQIFWETCRKKKPKTKISIQPGQRLRIDRVVTFRVFRALKLKVKVCKVTNVEAMYVVCRRFGNVPLPKSFPVYQTKVGVIAGCETVTFTLPVPNTNADLGATDCGHQSITGIFLSFKTFPGWKNKIVVKCVKFKGCLQNECIQI